MNKLLACLFALVWAGSGCEQLTSSMNQDEAVFFEPEYQPLARAVREGDTRTIDNELAEGLDVNHVGKQNMTLLMWAIVNKNKRSLTYLLEEGANPNYKDGQGTQPVGLAAGLDDIDYLRILLDHKGDPNSEDRDEKALITAILSLFKPHIYLLLDKGADINATKKDNQVSAVTLLANLNQFEDVANFLRRNADHLKASSVGRTLPYAVQDATPNKGTAGYEWQKKVKQMLQERGVRFPVESPFYTKPAWQPIRQRWYESPQGQAYRARLEELGRNPEGFGEKWRALHQQEEDAFEQWVATNNISEPE